MAILKWLSSRGRCGEVSHRETTRRNSGFSCRNYLVFWLYSLFLSEFTPKSNLSFLPRIKQFPPYDNGWDNVVNHKHLCSYGIRNITISDTWNRWNWVAALHPVVPLSRGYCNNSTVTYTIIAALWFWNEARIMWFEQQGGLRPLTCSWCHVIN